jgi:NitT/TauT family transport system substrate-binding protein
MNLRKPCHRRHSRLFVLALASALLASACGGSPKSSGLVPVTHQLGWIASTQSIGEIVAQKKGFFREEGLDVKINLGGPNIDGVALVASGRADIGQIASSPSLLLAASQDIPVRAIAVGGQQHPYGFVSMPDKRLNTPADLRGRKIGSTSTGVVLINALLEANNIPRNSVKVVATGTEITPLLTGQVDAFGAWRSNASWLRQLPKGYGFIGLWENGVQLYPLPYYATEKKIKEEPELLAKFLRALARGWEFARDNQKEAVDILVKAYPNLKREDEAEGLKALLPFAFTEKTDTEGWGAMDDQVWQRQIDLLARVGVFGKGKTPTIDMVRNTAILKANAGDRMSKRAN